eukprot:157860-Chlamydomonas_euryale.AAC.1
MADHAAALAAKGELHRSDFMGRSLNVKWYADKKNLPLRMHPSQRDGEGQQKGGKEWSNKPGKVYGYRRSTKWDGGMHASV